MEEAKKSMGKMENKMDKTGDAVADKMSDAGNAAKKGGSKIGKMIIWILAGVGVVIVLGIVALVFFLKGPADVARSFVEHLAAEEFTQAYELTASEFRAETKEDALPLFVQSFPILEDPSDISFNERATQDNYGQVVGTITGADGKTSPITEFLIKEDGNWKVLAVSLNEEDAKLEDDIKSIFEGSSQK